MEKIASLCKKEKPILLDIKGLFQPAAARKLGINYWRL